MQRLSHCHLFFSVYVCVTKSKKKGWHKI